MGTLGETIVVDELRISLLSPTLRCLVNLFGEGAYGDRDLDASRVEETSRQIVGGVPVEACRGDRGVRQPVQRDVVEDIVPRQPFGLAVENASDHLVAANVVVEHPRREADR